MGKDEFFIAVLLLFAWTVTEYASYETGGLPEKKQILRYLACAVTGLLVCLLRSNGIFIFVGTVFVLFAADVQKKNFSKAGSLRSLMVKKYAFFAAALLCYLLYHGPILHAMQVEPPDTIEGLTMPTQHILCAYLKGGELSDKDRELIAQAVPLEGLEECYNPYLFDPVKAYIREEGNQQAIEEHKWEYFKLWLRLGVRNPLQYVVAEVRQTMGYWAYRVKDYQYLYSDYFMVDNPFGVTAERKFFTYNDSLKMDAYLNGFQDFFNRVWSLGLTTWLAVFALAYSVYEKKRVMIFVPYGMLLVSLLLAAPVYNEFRYTYGMFVALPLLLSDSFGGNGIRNVGVDDMEADGVKEGGAGDEKAV